MELPPMPVSILLFDPVQKKIDLKVLIKLRWGHVKSIKEHDHMCR